MSAKINSFVEYIGLVKFQLTIGIHMSMHAYQEGVD